MHYSYKKSVFIISCIVLCSSIAFGESNFDFFFKTSAQYKNVTIKEVRSTDTFVLEGKIGEKGETIKMIGLKAPEAPRKKKKDIKRDQFGFAAKEPVSPLTTLEEQAFEFVSELLQGKHVRLEFDAEKKANDHATLAYVFLVENNTFVNVEIVRHGFAHLHIRPPNTKYAKELRKAYKEARAEQRGLQGQ